MSSLVEAFAGFSKSGGLGSILKVVLAGTEGISSISAANAQAAEFSARGEQEAAQKEFEATKLEREKKAMHSRQRALYAKAGVFVGAGSPLEVMEETRKEYDIDIANTRTIGNLALLNAKRAASNIKSTGFLKGAKTILSGISDFADSPLMQKEKTFSSTPGISQRSGPATYIPGAWG